MCCFVDKNIFFSWFWTTNERIWHIFPCQINFVIQYQEKFFIFVSKRKVQRKHFIKKTPVLRNKLCVVQGQEKKFIFVSKTSCTEETLYLKDPCAKQKNYFVNLHFSSPNQGSLKKTIESLTVIKPPGGWWSYPLGFFLLHSPNILVCLQEAL